MDKDWWRSIPWNTKDEEGPIDKEDLVNQALDYFIERCKLDKVETVENFSEGDIELIRETTQAVINRLEPSGAWVLLNVVSAMYSRIAMNKDEIQNRLEGAIDQAFGGTGVDVKVVDMSDSDDPLSKLLRGMPDDPSSN